jgi:hypothetical protein
MLPAQLSLHNLREGAALGKCIERRSTKVELCAQVQRVLTKLLSKYSEFALCHAETNVKHLLCAFSDLFDHD